MKKPKAKFINTEREFKWRIEYNGEVSRWALSYDSLLVHKFKDEKTFCLATAYWEGTLPIEEPFEIIMPR